MSIDKYLEKSIIAWHDYNENHEDQYGRANTISYVYPQLIEKSKNNYEPISYPLDEFPQQGRIAVKIQGGENAADVTKRLGSLVEVTLTQYPETNPNPDAYTIYSLKYKSDLGKKSAIWMERFSGKGFYQVLDLQTPLKTDPIDRSIPLPVSQIYTRLILLRYENKMYGPFEYEIKDELIFLFGDQGHAYIVAEYDATTCNDEIFVIVDRNAEESVLLLPMSALHNPLDCEKTYDWISKEKLIDIFLKCLKNRECYNKNQLNQLKETLTLDLISDEHSNFTEDRAELLKVHLLEIFQKAENVRALIEFTLDDENLKETIINNLLANHFDTISSNLTECTVIQDEIQQLETKKKSLESDIEGFMNQKAPFSSEIASETTNKNEEFLDLLEENRELTKQNESLLEKVSVVEKYDELCENIEDLEKKKQTAQEEYENKMREKFSIEDAIKKTLKDFGDTKELTQKLLEDKLLERVIRSFSGEQQLETTDFHSELSVTYEAHTGHEIIAIVSNYIREFAHRNVTDNDVINYLICITQGFITTFAGEPGTGKTSICNIFAKALGLFPQDAEKRYIDISVERGWTSHKDFIGYYNPLTKTLEKSNAEVFEAFTRLQQELQHSADEMEDLPFLFLLDEANLSPIEHYWAAFLKLCDLDLGDNRNISLGGQVPLIIPEYMRFLATVNFDHTTEELSPRFLDRSWIICLDPASIDDESSAEEPDNIIPITYTSLKKAFYSGEVDKIDESILSKWNKIQSIFKSEQCALPIMPRNLKMVKRYCAVACKWMNRDTPLTKLAPLDYAFSQKILPTINGSGDKYKNLITALLEECTEHNMPISAKHLQKMQRAAEENMGFYQFFTH